MKIFKPDLSYIRSPLIYERRIIYPDIRGRGNSARDPDWRNYHPAVCVGDVRYMLAALNLHKAFVDGTSMGGIMAMIMGAVMPGSVTGALINDVRPDIDDEGLDDIVDYLHRVDKIFAD